MRVRVAATAAAVLLATACGGIAGGTPSTPARSSPVPTSSAPVTSGEPPATATTSATSTTPARALPLAGKVVVLDPGHNPGDAAYPTQVNALVDIVNGRKACDAVGASTDGGYPENAFTYDVATRAAAVLRARGATVVLTRSPATPWGPCITERAAIGNRAHAAAAVSIHADGAPASGYGFHVIMPGPVGPNDAIVAPSRVLGRAVHTAFAADTGESPATYLAGGTGYDTRTDLGGLNLSTVPKVFVECANMRNPADAAKVTSAAWRQRAAQGIADGITAYLTGP